MKGYMVLNQDWTYKGFQYKVGETYDAPRCGDGFRFCTILNHAQFHPDNKVAEVEALGETTADSWDSRCCTDKIRIIRELPWDEVLKHVNIGHSNTGKCNTGYCNSGDWNSGYYNGGNRNTGKKNTGNRNSGNHNTGSFNSGNWNDGSRNSGDWNRTSFSSGCFNTEEATILMFNKPSGWTYRDWQDSEAKRLLDRIRRDVLRWVYCENMTDEEKKQHPEYKATGGYLKELDESECGQIWWDGLTDEEKDVIRALPNFDAGIFEQTTGVRTGS